MNRRTITLAASAVGFLAQTQGFALGFAQTIASTSFSNIVEGTTLRAPAPFNPLVPTGVFPGQVAIDVDFGGPGYFLSARNGGGQISDALVTTATTIGPNERFTVQQTADEYLSFQTAGGEYVSMVDGVSDPVLTTETVLTAPADSTLLTARGNSPNYYPGVYTLEDYYNYYLDFSEGNLSTGAVGISPSLDTASYVSVRHCGDLGSGYQYAIYMNNNYYQPASSDGNYINPIGALSGSTGGALYLDDSPDGNNQFTLVRQDDGSYALLLHNGINYVTALDGGGLDGDYLAANRTVAQAWEKFRITDQGNCTYTIQTTSGYYLATSGGSYSTDISDPAAAPSVGFNAYFVFRPIWN